MNKKKMITPTLPTTAPVITGYSIAFAERHRTIAVTSVSSQKFRLTNFQKMDNIPINNR